MKSKVTEAQITQVYLRAEEELPELRKAAEEVKEETKQAKAEGGKKAGRGRPNSLPSREGKLSPPRQAREASAKRAVVAGVSRSSFQRGEKLRKSNPVVANKLADGVIKPKEASNIMKRQDRDTRIAKAETATPEGKYCTIVVDPPWAYESRDPRINPDYQPDTMSFEEFEKWSVKNMKKWFPDEGGHMYLWVTDEYAGDVNRLFRAWGYEQKAVLVWVKSKFGMGSWYRHKHELCFFAVKGKLPGKRNDVATVFEAPSGANSAKPDKFFEIVESMSPGPRLVVFSRKKREGWDVFGNEVNT